MRNDFVNIVGITYGRLAYTKQWLEAIHATSDIGSYPFKITVVNNFHPTENEENETWLREQLANGQIDSLCLMSKNVGVAKAANAGWMREPNAAYFLKLDNDMIAQKDGWLDRMVEAYAWHEQETTKIGTLGYSVEVTSYPVTQGRNPYHLRIKQANIGGACLFVGKAVENIIGNFCEAYKIYGEEDADFNMRLSLRGHWNAYMEDEGAFFHLPAGKAAIIDVNNNFKAADGKEEINETEYRAYKDSFRSENVPILMKRWEGYRQGTVPIKQVSNADKDFRFRWVKNGK